MKAWLVGEKGEFCAIVVFAETRGKAKYIALNTDFFEGADFCKIEARRLPKADKIFKEGKTQMDWENDKDRIFLVKELGFRCEEIDAFWCERCPAKEYCEAYQDYKEEQDEVTENE